MNTAVLLGLTSGLKARGPLSAVLLEIFVAGRRRTPAHEELTRLVAQHRLDPAGMIHDDDAQFALFLLYGLHYGWLGTLGDDLEWDLDLLAARQHLEARHEQELHRLTGEVALPEPRVRAVAQTLFELTADDGGPSLARFVARTATVEQVRELMVLRSIYTLREADPHSWAIPRLIGRSKAALIEIQNDEYGGGHLDLMHSSLFAVAMRGVGLDDAYLAYLDQVPAVILASHNTMSLFGLNLRLRGALVGHLAAFEMTSSIPNRFLRDGFARLGFGQDVQRYFAEHVEADAVHEQIAAYDLAGSLAEQEPALVPDIMFGAASSLAMDAAVAEHVLSAWKDDRSSLRRPVTGDTS